VFSKTVHDVRGKHGVAILVKKGIKAERLRIEDEIEHDGTRC
jgi:hypothetical protein